MNKKNIIHFRLKNAIHGTIKDSIKMHRCGIVMSCNGTALSFITLDKK